jgi:dehydrogenase/reductase SDR family protein 12
MTRLHETIETNLPLDVAFPFVADFANSERWDPGVRSSIRVDDGPVAVGATYKLEVRMGGRSAPMEYRVTAFEPGRRVVLAGRGSGVTAVDEISFTQTESGTHIDYVADIKLGGVLGLIQPLLGGAFRKVATEARDGMKRTLDAMASAG